MKNLTVSVILDKMCVIIVHSQEFLLASHFEGFECDTDI